MLSSLVDKRSFLTSFPDPHPEFQAHMKALGMELNGMIQEAEKRLQEGNRYKIPDLELPRIFYSLA